MKGATNMLSTIILGWIIYLTITGFCDDLWYSKLRYSTQYNVEFSEITKQNEPHDCSFVGAPIGSKGCHYERKAQYTSIQISTDKATGRPIYSSDEGKTWNWNDYNLPANRHLYVSWEKVEDE